MTRQDPVAEASRRVELARPAGDTEPLAAALEELATAAVESGELLLAAGSLEEAASVWTTLGRRDRTGLALLLAAGSRRLAGDLAGAAYAIGRGRAAGDSSAALVRAFDMEEGEQRLAAGKPEAAIARYTAVLHALPGMGDTEGDQARAQILQRRAAAAIEAQIWRSALEDLVVAESLYRGAGRDEEADDAALGAALAEAHVDLDAAERRLGRLRLRPAEDPVWRQKLACAAARIAEIAGDGAAAVVHFGDARAAALDAADPLGYLDAAVRGSSWAAAIGADADAYGLLATAWVTLDDALGEGAGRQLLRPPLEQLRERLGEERFGRARAAYEAQRRGRATGAPTT